MGTEIPSTKRKRSVEDLAATASRKKAPKAKARKATLSEPRPPNAMISRFPACPLIQALRQYGLLEAITSCLFPCDLLALALSCKAAYNAVLPRPESLDNLLSKVNCSGNGIKIRQRVHKKSSFFYAFECIEFAQCSTTSKRQNVESRPCISCKVTTCDECRIHCVYQSIYEAPIDTEDLPNFSGFVLLDPFEVAILSPHHLPSETNGEKPWQNPATNATTSPYHDQGFLDMPLDLDNETATPERISDVLDVDLGQISLRTWSSSSQWGSPSPVLRSLCNTVEARKLSLCESCTRDAQKGPDAITPPLPRLPWLDVSGAKGVSGTGMKECHCTLRKRILDRWQCVKCYEGEEALVGNVTSVVPGQETGLCRCMRRVKNIVCLWCWGEVLEGSDAYTTGVEDGSSP